MSGTADPHEPPPLPAFQSRVTRYPSVVRCDGPARIYDQDAADPDWTPRPVGFLAPIAGRVEPQPDEPSPDDVEPLLWEGDQA